MATGKEMAESILYFAGQLNNLDEETLRNHMIDLKRIDDDLDSLVDDINEDNEK